MNQLIEAIKEIPIEDVLKFTGIKYESMGDVLSLHDHDGLTSGWKAKISDNIVNNFSPHKNRAIGNPFDFVMRLHNFSEEETVKWFKEKYPSLDNHENLAAPVVTVKPEEKLAYSMKEIATKWDGLPECTQDQIDYMYNRGINYESLKGVVKNISGRIASPIMGWVGEDFGMLTVQSRDIHSKQFRILAGTKSKGVFMNGINSKIKHVYVVEGMFDYLSLRQFTTNVIGLKSCNDGIEVVKDMHSKGYSITIISDNDDAGKKMLTMFADIDYYWFDIGEYGNELKDLNDLLVGFGVGAQIIGTIEEQKTLIETEIRKDYEIKEYSTLLSKGSKELNAEQDALSRGFPVMNQILGYMQGGELILLGAKTGVGKSTFCRKIASNVVSQGYKVGMFSLEDRQEDAMKQEIYYEVGLLRKSKGLKNYPKYLFMANKCNDKDYEGYITGAMDSLKEKNKNILNLVNNTSSTMPISELEELIGDFVKRGCKLIIIDHLHYFKINGGGDRHDLEIEQAMQEINGIARKHNVVIFLVAHYKKIGDSRPNDESFKDAVSIAQVPNKVLHIHRDKNNGDGTVEIIITKNRGMGICTSLTMFYDQDIGSYTHVIKDVLT